MNDPVPPIPPPDSSGESALDDERIPSNGAILDVGSYEVEEEEGEEEKGERTDAEVITDQICGVFKEPQVGDLSSILSDK